MEIDKEGNMRKWFDVPLHPKMGVTHNMGVALGPNGYVYLCNNQGWSKKPELLFKSRVLKVKADEKGNILD